MKAIDAAALLTLALLGLAGPAWADGAVLGTQGVPVPAEEQRAFIDWHDGRERLFVATRTAPHPGPSLWVIPVPAAPRDVKAEPVGTFPRVVAYRSEVEAARDRITEVRNAGLVLDSGFLVVFALMGHNLPARFALTQPALALQGVRVHRHVERLDLVVEVVTAESATALDQYLAGHPLDTRADRLTALAPYFREPYTFVCAWAAAAPQAAAARALAIDFPSPTIYYPLRPSQIYGADLATALYVRGWVRPRGEGTPTVRCRYGHGAVRDEAVEQVLGGPGPSSFRAGPSEPLTRVELTGPPQTWTADLVLEPGTPAVVHTAAAVNALGPWLVFLVTAAVGVVLAAFLPWVVVPRKLRGWEDYVWATLVGAATCLSILAAAMVFYAWCCDRKPAGRQAPLSRFSWVVLGTAGLSLAVLALAVGLRDVAGLAGPALSPVVFVAVVVFAVTLPFAVICLVYAAAHETVIWLVVFAVVHLGVIVGLCEALAVWFSTPV